jgi:tripartite-type tricarboxylate transporter receptor subunit TctC
MLLPRFELISLFSAGLMVLGPAAVCSQDYPSKPIRIVTSGVGGGNDFVARLFAQALAVNLGQQVIVDNRGSGVAPGQAVYQAPPDGYTQRLQPPCRVLKPNRRSTEFLRRPEPRKRSSGG